MEIGYIRVSTADQETNKQLQNHKLDFVFDEYASGANQNRPRLQELKNFARKGDTVYVESIDRLARNLSDLIHLVKHFTEKGVTIKFMRENLTFDGNDTPLSKFTLSIMGAFAEFERSIMRERQRVGIEIAKKKGVYANMGRKPKFFDHEVIRIKDAVRHGEKVREVARRFKTTPATVYKCLRKKIDGYEHTVATTRQGMTFYTADEKESDVVNE